MNAVRFFTLTICLSGCVVISTSKDHEYETNESRNLIGNVSAIRVDGVEPKIVVGGNPSCFELQLIATGEFEIHEGYMVTSTDKGEPVVAVGFFPGYGASSLQGGVIPMSILGNYVFALVPTLSALFIEPFRDRWSSEKDGMNFTDIALLGCRKYWRQSNLKPQDEIFREVARRKSVKTVLYGYSVLVNGIRYEAHSGVVRLPALSRGSSVSIVLLTSPSLMPDSKDVLSDLVGVEMSVVCS